jgi:hypothetical protein
MTVMAQAYTWKEKIDEKVMAYFKLAGAETAFDRRNTYWIYHKSIN